MWSLDGYVVSISIPCTCYKTNKLSVNILIPRGQLAAAIVILVLLYISLFLLAICFLRTFLTIIRDPGAVPLPPDHPSQVNPSQQGGHRYKTSTTTEEAKAVAQDGMAQFWTKDTFICTESGQPRWCSTCSNWKPDRSHHSKELGRCIRKMDHYCPWMGGMISETC